MKKNRFNTILGSALFLTYGCLHASEYRVNEVSDQTMTKPQCKFIGSDSEGWYRGDEVLKFISCVNKQIVCKFEESDSEGWYVLESYRMDYSTCAETKKPECKFIDSDSEGWYIDQVLVKYARCSGFEAVCRFTDSDSEGWFAEGNEMVVEHVQCKP